MREDVKDQKLTFTEIAKLVGECWQSPEPTKREAYESQANDKDSSWPREKLAIIVIFEEYSSSVIDAIIVTGLAKLGHQRLDREIASRR